MQNAIAALLDEHETGFGIGILGAIGEFIRDADEMMQATALSRVTARGGIAIRLDHPAPRLLAWEEVSTDPRLWKQAAALISPSSGWRRTSTTPRDTDSRITTVWCSTANRRLPTARLPTTRRHR